MHILENIRNWSKNSVVDEILIFAMLIAAVESVAQNTLKTSTDGSVQFVAGLAVYGLVGYFLHYIYHEVPLGKLNTIWSCISIILGVTIGKLMYNEPISHNTIISVLMAVAAVYFSNLS